MDNKCLTSDEMTTVVQKGTDTQQLRDLAKHCETCDVCQSEFNLVVFAAIAQYDYQQTCPDSADLVRYCKGQPPLVNGHKLAISQHCQNCDHCKREVETLRAR